jgi:hypothetical protein
MNRIYNANNELICRDIKDNLNTEFNCPNFSTDSANYENENKREIEVAFEHAEKKVRNIFVWLSIILVIGLFQVIYTEAVSLIMGYVAVACAVLVFGVFFTIYLGKKWAVTLINILSLPALYILYVELGEFKSIVIKSIIAIIGILSLVYVLYIVNIDKSFKLYIRYKNDKLNSN